MHRHMKRLGSVRRATEVLSIQDARRQELRPSQQLHWQFPSKHTARESYILPSSRAWKASAPADESTIY